MREKKKLGNKGFSLVELIVVIAIMAVLIAVLAPTLISKIEESREGTDLQAIGEINSAVKNALGNEKVYKEVVPATGAYYYEMSNTCAVSGKTELTKELQKTLEEIEWKSNAASASDAKTYIIISSAGKVYVKRATTADAAAISIKGGDDQLEAGSEITGATAPQAANNGTTTP